MEKNDRLFLVFHLPEWYGILATVFLVKNSEEVSSVLLQLPLLVIQLTEVMFLFPELQQA